jgi:hypothetical protein
LLELEKIVARLEERVKIIGEQTGGLLELRSRATAVDQRVTDVRRDLGRIETSLKETGDRIQQAEQFQRAIAEKRLEESRSRRWDLLKLFLTAILASALTLATGLLSKLVERVFPEQPSQSTTRR